ncbi:hypothetical protein QAD02_010230 [Eretmocerus hayati]|uniref:Uncharacterized protein n=1 Tax=Eretmocerus hayati TaxID=131215 RepID=A0ACC2NBN4_9HYME|nr:hypothetical protein QAD02_010230 [Eretmocerus hayati]
MEWNEHTIRKQDGGNVVSGKPNELYHCPELFGSQDYGKVLNEDHMDALMDYTDEPQLIDPEFARFVDELMPGKSRPATAEEAFVLYLDIMEEIMILDEQINDEFNQN